MKNLEEVLKARLGEERPGHKYVRRVKTPKGWRYLYKEGKGKPGKGKVAEKKPRKGYFVGELDFLNEYMKTKGENRAQSKQIRDALRYGMKVPKISKLKEQATKDYGENPSSKEIFWSFAGIADEWMGEQGYYLE